MKNYYIFGAGNTGREIYEEFKDKINIVAFIDNNKALHGSKIGKAPVIPPLALSDDDTIIIGVSDVYLDSVIKDLRKISNVNYITYDKLVFDYYKDTIKEIAENYFEDDFSRETYEKILACRAANDFTAAKEVNTPNQYFCLPQFTENKTGGIFVDAGAYIGDTVEFYLTKVTGHTSKIISVEPGQEQYNELMKAINKLTGIHPKIECILGALSDTDGEAGFVFNAANQAGSRIMVGKDSLDVKTYRLDSVIKSSETVDYIKADVEGSELSLLKGAVNTLKRCKPKLAICLYHNPNDFIFIPKYIKSVVPEYKMWVRHHTDGRYETVLYCSV